MKDIKRSKKRQKGALTIEAAIVMPVLLCAVFSIIFIIKAVYTYELIQHALEETASEIATAGYIYHISGLRDIHDTARNGINERSETFKNHIGSVFDCYESFRNINDKLSDGLPDINETAELISKSAENFNNMLNTAEEVLRSPLDEIKNIACYIAGGSFNDAKTQLFNPVVKMYMKKYITAGSNKNADEMLKDLNVVGGMDGLDFSRSSFLADKDENIDIQVKYRIRLPLPFQFGSGLVFVQRVKVKAWLGGDESGGVLNGNRETEDIWSLNNFQRGLKIRKIFGANLPTNFPVIAKFENGKATMIKSMDLTAASYQNGDNTSKTIKGYIKELAEYRGQNKPWGSSGTIITESDIKIRELLLVIPQNELSEENEKIISEMTEYARSIGVSLIVKRYGLKEVNDSDKTSN